MCCGLLNTLHCTVWRMDALMGDAEGPASIDTCGRGSSDWVDVDGAPPPLPRGLRVVVSVAHMSRAVGH